ncbi:XRE family transcriptional regulator [Propioniciclava sinopodophylli]|uniref:XRE family transcriptional regulator n=1 Tax=Propioniciclava sinopodophylli TaxID=1837344 RepID=A0A4Q9KEB6_9ACTN|nr:XRE family transcriptional regulator [Propioniciclava sinopodophylli]TBT85421.1 XRE family transcriptional regulator [Propioniciclava sinopodophylli]
MAEHTFSDRLKLRRAAAGLTQRQLADLSGVKQPLIAAIERGTRAPSDAARAALERALRVRPSMLLRARRDDVLAAVARVGAKDPRVFGSVARGDDSPGSDIDLLVTFPPEADIVTLLTLEEELAELLTVPVDVVSCGSSGRVIDRARAEAVPL